MSAGERTRRHVRAPRGQRATCVDLPIDDVYPSPLNPRRHFDDEALAELAESIRRDGVMQPIVVRLAAVIIDADLTIDGYVIVMGERRWRASKLAGQETIPAVVREDLTDGDHLRLALVENLQRQDLDSPLALVKLGLEARLREELRNVASGYSQERKVAWWMGSQPENQPADPPIPDAFVACIECGEALHPADAVPNGPPGEWLCPECAEEPLVDSDDPLSALDAPDVSADAVNGWDAEFAALKAWKAESWVAGDEDGAE